MGRGGFYIPDSFQTNEGGSLGFPKRDGYFKRNDFNSSGFCLPSKHTRDCRKVQGPSPDPLLLRRARLDGLSYNVCGAPPPLPRPVILESGLPAAGPGFPRAPALPLPTLPVTHILRPHCLCSGRPPLSHWSLWGGARSWGLERERAASAAVGGGEDWGVKPGSRNLLCAWSWSRKEDDGGRRRI